MQAENAAAKGGGMKSLVRIVAPANYIHKGREVYINPNEVSSVVVTEPGTVAVQMKDGGTAYSGDCISKVVADIEAAL